MSTTIVSFDCGAGIILDGQTVANVIEDHASLCGLCPDMRTDHEKQLDELNQKNWEARVDAALNEARKVTP